MAAEAALRAAEIRAREAQIEVSRRISEVQQARMGVDLARSEVDLRQLKGAAKTSAEKSRIKALESRVSLLRRLINEDLPEMRELQGRMLKAQLEEPGAVPGIQMELTARQRVLAGTQMELEVATLRASGADPARIQAMERRIAELKKQAAGETSATRGEKPTPKKKK